MQVKSLYEHCSHFIKYYYHVANQEKTENPDYQKMAELHRIKNVLQYTADEMKTEQHYYVTGVNCSDDYEKVSAEFEQTKTLWNKHGGIVCFHGYQSFKRGEVSAEEAHQIGIELAQALWGDRFEVLVSSHLNTGTMHCHFCVNSVSFVDGKKFYASRETYQRMRDESDRICREHGLSVIEQPSKRSKHIAEVKAERTGHITDREKIRRDIDYALADATDYNAFARIFESYGYTLEWRYGKLYARPDLDDRFFRLDNLGDDYTKAAIENQLQWNYYHSRELAKERYRPQKSEKPHGLYALYLHYQFLLGNLPLTKPDNRELYVSMKEDIKKMERYSAEAVMLGKHHIDTGEQLRDYYHGCEADLMRLSRKRQSLRNKLRRMHDTEEMQPIKEQISALSEKIQKCRKEIEYCKDIAGRSGAIEQIMDDIHAPEQTKNQTEPTKEVRKKNDYER